MNNKKIIIGITAEGSVNLLLGQLAYFKSLGYKTYLLAPYSERSAKFCQDEGCEHLIVNIEREISLWKDIKTLWQIFWIFKKVKPDIVNLGTPKVSLLGMIAAALLRVPKRIYTCRGFRFEHERGIKKTILLLMERYTARFSTNIICISNSLRNMGVKSNIFTYKKSQVILKGSSNGINLTLFNPLLSKHLDKANELKDKYNLNDKFVFLFVGRIYDRKGIVELYNSFNKLYGVFNDVVLMLVGPYEQTQIKNKEIIHNLNNHPNIIHVGSVLQEDVPPYFSLSNVFVFPCWGEGFGNVLIQSAAMGTPVISTFATGTVDAVSNNFNGILIPVKDELALYESMLKLYENKELRQLFRQNGPLWSKNFDRELIWNEMNKIYLS